MRIDTLKKGDLVSHPGIHIGAMALVVLGFEKDGIVKLISLYDHSNVKSTPRYYYIKREELGVW